MKLLKPLAIAALLTSALSVQAHRAWILPDVTVLSGDEPAVTFDLAVSNSLFNFDHVPFRVNGLAIEAPNGDALEPENVHTGKFRTVFDLTLKQEGTYRVFVASQGLFARWENDEGKRQMYPQRGQQFDQAEFDKVVPKKAKNLEVSQTSRRLETFVTSGNSSKGALALTNKGLEVNYLTHPNDLFTGEEATLEFYIDGKPAVGVEISVIREGTRYRNNQNEQKLTSDKKGQVKITWNEAGRYYLAASYKDKAAQKPATVRTGSYSAVLEVLPE
ncbi:MAG: DUF4198 domain-containing protein [Venatoribacter sp.]